MGTRPAGIAGATMRHYAHIPTSARPAILAAARHLFAERGFAGTSMREIAEAAGVSKAAIYHHFRDKRRLYRELLDEGINTLTAAMRRLPDKGPARAPAPAHGPTRKNG